ncbi:MAG TPA: selenoneine biosynthesis selenosugar synthase SenB [Candidatus Binatia bacterium]|nr:selenoneine biosynthesis selenosugar synthase SenB [Candidatus Binatia bacterium]
MKIQLATPAPLRLNNGNKISAVRWSRILRGLGHKVDLVQHYSGMPCDALIALHARRSYKSITRFHQLHAELPLVVVLTGTDVYKDIHTDPKAQHSLKLATRLIVLQKQALAELPRSTHAKTRVIYQSAEPYRGNAPKKNKPFKVCVIGHLRAEKDPLRVAMASRQLPVFSNVEVLHVGKALDPALGKQAQAEAAINSRYSWVGELPYWMTRRVLARSHLLAITSEMEGSSNVLSEALASSVPVIVTRIPGLMGTLGKDYPGYFPVGDTSALAELLLRAEYDTAFYRSLKRACERAAPLVQPQREIASWKLLLRELQQWKLKRHLRSGAPLESTL